MIVTITGKVLSVKQSYKEDKEGNKIPQSNIVLYQEESENTCTIYNVPDSSYSLLEDVAFKVITYISKAGKLSFIYKE